MSIDRLICAAPAVRGCRFDETKWRAPTLPPPWPRPLRVDAAFLVVGTRTRTRERDPHSRCGARKGFGIFAANGFQNPIAPTRPCRAVRESDHGRVSNFPGLIAQRRAIPAEHYLRGRRCPHLAIAAVYGDVGEDHTRRELHFGEAEQCRSRLGDRPPRANA